MSFDIRPWSKFGPSNSNQSIYSHKHTHLAHLSSLHLHNINKNNASFVKITNACFDHSILRICIDLLNHGCGTSSTIASLLDIVQLTHP